MKTSKLVFGIFMKRFYLFVPGIIILAIEVAINTFIPRQIGLIVDELTIVPDTLDALKRMVLILAGVSVCAFILKFIWRFFLIGNGRWYEKALRKTVFNKLSELDSTFYDNNRTGDLITRVISDVSAIRMSLAFGVVSIFEISMTLIMPLSVMIQTMSLPLTLSAFAVVPFIIAFLIIVRKKIAQRFVKIQEATSELSNKVDENLSGIREIKSYAHETHESKEFEQLSKNRYNTEIRQVRLSASLGPVSKIGFAASFAIFIVIGGVLVFNGKMSVGEFITFNSYIGIMTSPMMRISKNVQVWQKGIASMKRLDGIFLSEPLVSDINADTSIVELVPDIEITNLSFGYILGKKVLDNINIHIAPGKTLGIMGKTGSGKSALLNAISRRYPISPNQIKIDGHDINNIPLDVLKSAYGSVVQNGFLFSDTVAENIRFYCTDISDEDILQASKIADLHDNIQEFPEKYETIVGERGVTLSGGQRQRIALARAIVKKPRILFLDDCMSAVDTATEEKIIKNIKEYLNGVTTVITAHRISAVAHADEIIYLEDGNIVERGNHEQLIALRGRYYDLYVSQTEGRDTTK